MTSGTLLKIAAAIVLLTLSGVIALLIILIVSAGKIAGLFLIPVAIVPLLLLGVVYTEDL